MGKGSRNRDKRELEVVRNLDQLNGSNNGRNAHIAVRQMVRSGPIPSPDDLRSYEDVCPGAADRIIAMAEKEQQNRHKNEQLLVESVSKGNLNGIKWAGTISVLVVVGGIICIMSDHDFAGVFLGASGLIGIISAFLKNTSLISPDKNENKEKDI